MVADFDKGDNVKEILSRGTKEVSVIFFSSELEKMVSDEKYEQVSAGGYRREAENRTGRRHGGASGEDQEY